MAVWYGALTAVLMNNQFLWSVHAVSTSKELLIFE
jgi:hypothetical protein